MASMTSMSAFRAHLKGPTDEVIYLLESNSEGLDSKMEERVVSTIQSIVASKPDASIDVQRIKAVVQRIKAHKMNRALDSLFTRLSARVPEPILARVPEPTLARVPETVSVATATPGSKVRSFEELLALDNADELFKYAEMMNEEKGGYKSNPLQVFRLYEKAALKGHSGAMLKLIYFYGEGIGTEKNDDQSLFWQNKYSESLNEAEMQERRRKMHTLVHRDNKDVRVVDESMHTGHLRKMVEKYTSMALQYRDMADELYKLGSVDDGLKMSILLDASLNVKEIYATGVQLVTNGYVTSMDDVFRRLEIADSIKRLDDKKRDYKMNEIYCKIAKHAHQTGNLVKALEYYNYSLAEEKNDDATYGIKKLKYEEVLRNLDSMSTERNVRGIKTLTEIANGGMVAAQLLLAQMYMGKKHLGKVEVDLKVAYEWLTKYLVTKARSVEEASALGGELDVDLADKNHALKMLDALATVVDGPSCTREQVGRATDLMFNICAQICKK